MNFRFILKYLLLVNLLFFAPQDALGSCGAEVIGWGARSTGMGGVDIAVATDITAMVTNPAGLTQIEGKRFDLGVGSYNPWTVLKNQWNPRVAYHTDMFEYPIPQTGYAQHVPKKNYTLGIGIFGIGGAGCKTRINSPFFNEPMENYEVIGFSKVTPTIAFKINPKLSLGLAFNINYALCNFRKLLLGPAYLKLGELDGWGYGFTAGILYKMNDKFSFGLSYTSESNLQDLESKRSGLVELSPLIPAPEGGRIRQYPRTKVVDFQMPQKLGLGLSCHLTPRLLFALDCEWHNYHQSFKKLAIKLYQTDGFSESLSLPLNCHDIYALALGIEYRLIQGTALRLGYHYTSKIIDNNNIGHLLAFIDDMHHITFGIGHRWNSFEAGFGFSYGLRVVNRNKTGEGEFPAPEYDNSTLHFGDRYFTFSTSWFF